MKISAADLRPLYTIDMAKAVGGFLADLRFEYSQRHFVYRPAGIVKTLCLQLYFFPKTLYLQF
jgi:hypothetical protein